jgi:hypothetical protein
VSKFNFPSLVTAVLAEVEPPFAIFGHSGGALLGYEVARTLRRRAKAEPAHLFVSGQPAPDVDRTEPDTHRLPDAELIDACAARRHGSVAANPRPAAVLATAGHRSRRGVPAKCRDRQRVSR